MPRRTAQVESAIIPGRSPSRAIPPERKAASHGPRPPLRAARRASPGRDREGARRDRFRFARRLERGALHLLRRRQRRPVPPDAPLRPLGPVEGPHHLLDFVPGKKPRIVRHAPRLLVRARRRDRPVRSARSTSTTWDAGRGLGGSAGRRGPRSSATRRPGDRPRPGPEPEGAPSRARLGALLQDAYEVASSPRRPPTARGATARPGGVPRARRRWRSTTPSCARWAARRGAPLHDDRRPRREGSDAPLPWKRGPRRPGAPPGRRRRPRCTAATSPDSTARGCDPLFAELLRAEDARARARRRRPTGRPYLDLHLEAHRGVARILADLGWSEGLGRRGGRARADPPLLPPRPRALPRHPGPRRGRPPGRPRRDARAAAAGVPRPSGRRGRSSPGTSSRSSPASTSSRCSSALPVGAARRGLRLGRWSTGSRPSAGSGSRTTSS